MREKLLNYSLQMEHEVGGPKANGFTRILGITSESIDHLEAEVREGIRCNRITAVVDNQPYGWKCVVEIPIRRVGRYSERRVNLRTVGSWQIGLHFSDD